eukprot:1304459-Pleurochrysis_carterae.AAC.1
MKRGEWTREVEKGDCVCNGACARFYNRSERPFACQRDCCVRCQIDRKITRLGSNGGSVQPWRA